MTDVSRLLMLTDQGDPQAAEQLLPLVYDELRKLAAAKLVQERPGQTLQATALVHEAYLRLVGHQGPGTRGQEPADPNPAPGSWPPAPAFDSRGHFFAAAAEAMRRILIEQARRRDSLRRGGGQKRVALDQIEISGPEPALDIVALDEALAKFAQLDPQKAQLVKLRYFAGLTIPEVAQAMGISTTTADRYWAYARAWLHTELKKGETTAG